MIIVMFGLLGLIFGSFANAAVWRLHQQLEEGKTGPEVSIVAGRSQCTHCGHLLSAWDLVPVASYLYLRGKCRYCHKPIEDTPVAELLTAFLFVASYIWWPYNLATDGLTLGRLLFGFWLIFLVGFVILALYDLKWMLLPDRVVFPLISLAVVQALVRAVIFDKSPPSLLGAAGGVLAIAGLFYLLYLASRQAWIGFGDVKLAIVLGLLAASPLKGLLIVFVSSVLGSLAAVPLLMRGKSAAKTRIPYGPFLLTAAVVVVLFGSQIINWYLGLLHMPPTA